MNPALIVHSIGPSVTVQDFGRPGFLDVGLSCGGAADRLALFEGAALLGQKPELACLEMAGFGGEFEATTDLRIALTGAPMRATIEGEPIIWNASHPLPRGSRLAIGAATVGSYGYLHVGGGIDGPTQLGSRSAHLAAGLGQRLTPGQIIPVGKDALTDHVGFCLTPDPRFEGGAVRVVSGPQTPLFTPAEIDRFQATPLRRDTRGNRMGVRLLSDGPGFERTQGLSILSEAVIPGDIQITGDGAPFVLLSECQTTGGYPRIGTVLQADLPRVAQATAGAALQFEFLALDQAVKIDQQAGKNWRAIAQNLQRLIRRPEEIKDLLKYQMISGATRGDDLDRA